MKIKIIHFEEVGSTNDYAIRMITEGHLNWDCAILADIQRNGRGRLNNRTWVSVLGNFHCTYIINIEQLGIPETEIVVLRFHALDATCLFLRKLVESNKFEIKLPNDIQVNGKKIAGVLIEVSYPYAAIGIGINLIASPLPISTCIKDEFGKIIAPLDIVHGIYDEIYSIKKLF
ncbi:MAG: hypothetical protein LBT03_03170 [Holosporales bacterium]|jgi:BirA family biotin operon repressor/biotin-[acetyl-CoA-carboxylase] ligase|nr:hypothetical protein [Holosporales bacterium]